MAGALGLTAFAIWGAVHVDFSYNMLRLQAKGVESVVWEERILAKAGRSGFAALTTASSLEDLRRKRDAFAALPSVSKVESVLMLVPDRQPEKIKLIKQFAPLVEPIHVATATTLEPADLRAPLETLRRRLRLATEEGNDKVRSEVGPVQAKLEALLDKLAHADAAKAGRGLAAAPASDRARLRRQVEELSEEPRTPGRSSRETLRPSYGAAISERAGATCSASTRPWTSGSRPGRSAS